MRRIILISGLLAASALTACSGGSNSSSSGSSSGSSGTTASSGSSGSSATSGTSSSSGSTAGADYSLAVSPTSLSVPGNATAQVAVTIDRNVGASTFGDTVNLTLTLPDGGAPAGLSGTFAPSAVTATDSTLTVTVFPDAGQGSYQLAVVGTAGTTVHTVALPVTVTAPADTLLVDNDFSDNNANPGGTNINPSISDTQLPALLQGATPAVAYASYVQPSAQADTGPSTTVLAPYARVIWYCGEHYGTPACVTPYQEQLLQAYLDSGNKTLILLYEDMAYDWSTTWTDATTTNAHTFFASPYLPLNGLVAGENLNQPNGTTSFNHASYTAAGAANTPFAGFAVHVTGSSGSASLLNSDISGANVATGTDGLLSVQADDPANPGTTISVPIIVGRKNVGAASTSKVVLVGMPIENVDSIGTTSKQQLWNAILAY